MTNLKLNINGKFAVLPEDFALSFSAQSPIFSDGITGNAFSFPINLPLHQTNIEIFDSIHHLNAPYKKKKQGILEVCGIPLYEGDIEITCTTECNIQIVFKSKEQTLCEDLEKVELTDSMPTLVLETPGAGDNFWCYELNDPNPTIQYIIFVGATEYISLVLTSAADGAADLAAQINADFPGLAFSSGNQLKINIAEGDLVGFDATQSAANMTLTNPPEPAGEDVQDDIIANIKGIQAGDGTQDVAFPMMKWQNFYGTENPKFCNLVNFCIDSQALRNEAYAKEIEVPAPTDDEPDATTTISNEYCWYHTYVPQLSLKYILENAFAKAGYKFLYNPDTFCIAEFNRLLVLNNCSIDRIIDASDAGVEECINAMNNVLDLNDYVPESSAKDFLKKVFEQFGLYIPRLKDNCITFACSKDVINAPAQRLTSVCRWKSVPKRFEGYRLQYDSGFGGVRCPNEQLSDYFDGPNAENFTPPFQAPCYAQECEIDTEGKGDNPSIQANLKLPRFFGNGCSPETSVGDDKLECALMINWGQQQASDGSTYPFASHDNLDQDGNVLGQLSLEFVSGGNNADNYGIAQYSEPIRRIQYNRILSITACLDIATIVEILKWEHPWSVHTECGTFTGLVKSISFEVGDNLGDVTLEMVSLC